MASSSSSSSFVFHSLPHFNNFRSETPPNRRIHFRTRRRNTRPIAADKSSIPPPSATAAEVASVSEPTTLPVKKIPGSYGIPFLGPILDRLEYFYGNGGRDEFFKTRVQKYGSTVFRANMPPGPFISSDSRVVVLLDGKSFPILFDVSKVEKRDLFTGTYMPSTELTGGYRILSYLDPSEEKHAQLKNLMFYMLKSSGKRVIPEFYNTYTELFEGLESTLASSGKAPFNDAGDVAAFRFLGRAYFDADPAKTKLGSDAPKHITLWVLFNLGPVLSAGLPALVQEPLLHTFPLPPFLAKSSYKKLYDFVDGAAGPVLAEAENLGISRDEAVHNIVFVLCFNTFGGIKILFPNMLKWIGRAGVSLHADLAEEIRQAVKTVGAGKVTMAAMEAMPLMKSVVYESLRIEPPVPLQYAKAKQDLTIESHDAAFEVKAGEMLFGFQPFATKDPKIFDRPEEFVPDRFVGEEGEKLLKHVMWSNGPETESPTVGNKQCAGKDFVVLIARLFVVEFFRRYDSFDIELGASGLGAGVTFTSLKKARF